MIINWHNLTLFEKNALVAEHIMGEPMPTEFPVDWDISFMHQMANGHIKSRDGNWEIVHIYDEGDEQKWSPLNFVGDFCQVERVLDKLSEDYVIEMEVVNHSASSRADDINSIYPPSRWTQSKNKAESICIAGLRAKGHEVIL